MQVFAGASDHENMIALRDYVRDLQSRNITAGQALIDTVHRAAELAAQSDSTGATQRMMLYLEKVVIGESLLSRTTGDYYYGRINGGPANQFGDSGFLPIVRDGSSQFEHAIAGLVIGNRFWALGDAVASFAEWATGDGEQDYELYRRTVDLGRDVDDGSFKALADALSKRLVVNGIVPPTGTGPGTQPLLSVLEEIGVWINDIIDDFNDALSNQFIPFIRNIDPVILDLDGDGVELISADAITIFFDMEGDGRRERTGWISRDDGFLALDANRNGRVDGIDELFGRDGQSVITHPLPKASDL